LLQWRASMSDEDWTARAAVDDETWCRVTEESTGLSVRKYLFV